MTQKRNALLAMAILLLALNSGCAEYFPRTGTGDWQGDTRVTLLRNNVPVETDAKVTLRLQQDENSQNFFTRYPAISFGGNDSALAPTDRRPLSTIVVPGVQGDSTVDVRGRNANINTFIFVIPARTFLNSDALPQVSFSGSYVDDNTVEGTVSQSLPATSTLPARVFTATLRLRK